MTKEEEIISTVREALEAWNKGELSAVAALIAIGVFVNPQEVTEDDIKWSEKVFRGFNPK